MSRAEEAYRTALRADPSLLQPSMNLGRLHESRGEFALAAGCYRAALVHHPGNPMLQHLLAAANGDTTARAPRGYVQSLFDEQAPRFDAHLVGELEYRVPGELAALVRPALTQTPSRVLDLGCGTGLAGAALAGNGIELVGADLSAGMLAVARKRGIYTQLLQLDALDALAQSPTGSLHAVIAADVFIYIGDLAEIFTAAARVLSPGGLFAFSIELLETGSYRLQPSGRYAHAVDYLRSLAAAAELEALALHEVRILRQG